MEGFPPRANFLSERKGGQLQGRCPSKTGTIVDGALSCCHGHEAHGATPRGHPQGQPRARTPQASCSTRPWQVGVSVAVTCRPPQLGPPPLLQGEGL